MRQIFFFLTILVFASCSTSKKTDGYVFSDSAEKAKYIKSYDNALALWDVAYEETDVATSFGTAHVVMTGPKDAPPVVLLHGMDASSTMWFPNAKEVSGKFRVYSIDFPLEAGKSVASVGRLTNKDISQFYNEVFDHFQMTGISLVGASRGGWMAVYLALQPNNKIGKLVLLSPAQTFGGLKNPGKVLTAVMLKLFPSPKKLAAFFNSFSVHPDRIDNQYKQQFYLANVYGHSRPRFINMVRFSPKELNSLKIPVLVMIGDHDIVNDARDLEKAKLLIPNAETAMIKDAGHFLSIDQSDTINKKIVEFLGR